MCAESRATLKVERDECYSLVRYVQQYASELRTLSRPAGTVTFRAVLIPVCLALFLTGCALFHNVQGGWRAAIAPGIGLLAVALWMNMVGVLRQIRDRRMEARVVRRCLEQLTGVLESLVDLSFPEKVMVDIALNDARMALDTGSTSVNCGYIG